jgi:site-specific recombinase xerD
VDYFQGGKTIMVTEKNISQIADLWKEEKRQFVKKSTFAAYSLIVETHLQPAFGNLTAVTEKDVQDFVLQKLNGGLSQKTIKDMLIVLRMILKFGAKKNYCVYAPIDVIFPTDRERQELEVLSIANQKKIMRFVEENFTFRNLGIFICLSTGIRIGEICALTWDDIDTENGVIHIRKTIQRIYVKENGIKKTELLIDTPKTATSMRDIPMIKDLYEILKPLKKVVNNDYFVLTNEATPTEPRTYRNYYKKLLDKLGIPPIKFHGLRHSFATRCIESKCDYKTVSVILGHSNISTTLNLYVHPNYEQKKKCIDKMFRKIKNT